MYIKECRRSPSEGDDLSKAMTIAEHCKLSSAKSNSATILSLRLMDCALLPSTYNVLGWPGNSRTTPSKAAPMFGAEIATLLAYGKAARPWRGKRVNRKSRASLD